MKKTFLTVLTILLMFIIAGCRPEIEQNNEEREQLKVNFAPGNAMATLTYNTGTPIVLPNGESYTNGDLKPIWNYIANELHIDISDVTSQSQTGKQMMEIAASRKFEGADIFGGDVAEQIMSNGASGYFVNLNEHKDKLPDFFNYLDEYPLIKSAITAYDGGIYHIPYIAEQDEFSRVFYGRFTWVEYLLDQADTIKNVEKETSELKVHFDGYWKDAKARHDKNVIVLQNQASKNNKLNAKQALTELRSYIDETYPELEKRSDLYLGKNAQYDMDELIALLRVIRLSPKTLSKLATGQELPGVEIVPFFFRTKNQREELFKLVTFFGGTRTYGSNNFTNKFFIDENNELQYTFIQDDFFEGLDYLQDMFSEGLIHSDWDDQGNSANFRTLLYGSDLEKDSEGKSTVKQLGFMTYDFFASTASSSPTGSVKAMLPPLTTLKGEPEGTMHHFVEIPRTIMTNAWGVASHVEGKKLDKALELLNYFFTEKGSFVQNFGIPGVSADFDNLWETPRGDKVPTITDWLLESAEQYGSGDIAEFSRNFLGIRMAIGYKADIGFELQYMVPEGIEGYQLYVDAEVKTLNYRSTNNYMLLSPPVFSFTTQDRRQLNTISVGDEQLDMTYNFIKSTPGFKSLEEIKKSYINNNIDIYLEVHQRAYQRTQESKE